MNASGVDEVDIECELRVIKVENGIFRGAVEVDAGRADRGVVVDIGHAVELDESLPTVKPAFVGGWAVECERAARCD